MTQFSIYPVPGGDYVMDVQSDILDELPDRIVIPLVETHNATFTRLRNLNPTLLFGRLELVLITQQMAYLPQRNLRRPLGSLVAQRDEVIRAIDMLLGGV